MEFRELKPHEIKTVPPIQGWSLDPSQRVAGCFDNGEIIGVWATTVALHAEPIWIREDHRKSPVIIRRLWEKVKEIVKDMGGHGVVGIIPDDVPADKRLAEWLGATEIPGHIYLWLEESCRDQ